MINTISDAFGRPHKKNGSEKLPFSIKHTLEKTRSSLSVQELKLLVAAMVD
ncbi:MULTISPECIES: hypothetical protein [Novosphingobium]|uniref:Uncharacterized protein n=2 Tax=Novosphingobium TaxID=165696 RepID=G6EH77_9SPHN|nr:MULTISPECIES: hypothetical protein [Novosphingobium]EHJ59366.1 hypothetical protein NSU_3698 [Novosphingobium pentaromativorans US6-1]SLK02617.1 hypothetical protein SAMN06295987_104116 [Novosphingobium mathurense]